MTQNVLLAGATGMLGRQIAEHLLNQPDTRVRLLVRTSDDPIKQQILKPLLDRGAESIIGDLADIDSLHRATKGIDVIVSAVQGGPDVIIDGQVALAKAGKANGVRRILPSDFGLDLFKATPGEHLMFDLRRTADERIAETGIEQVNILQGAFMDMFQPGAGVIGDGVVNFWGDGQALIDVTTVNDTARMAARAAVDWSLSSGRFAFSGDQISILDAAARIEAHTGQHLEPHSLGDEAQLRAALTLALQDPSDPFKPVMLAYMLYMTNGQTMLTDRQDTRYADIQLEKFEAFATKVSKW